jgi:ribosome-associated protein
MADDLTIRDGLILPGSCLRVETARSGGPGGQHVNTTETKVHLFCDLTATGLHPAVVARVREARGRDISARGELRITCGTHRSRTQNLDEARARLAALFLAHLAPPKKRRATKPTRGSKERRIKKKKARSQVKAGRGRVRRDD